MATPSAKRGPLPGWLKTTDAGVVLEESTATAIRTIVEMRTEQEASYSEIARALNGTHTSRGARWTTERIAKYLSPEQRARMGGQDTPVRLLSPDTLERLDEVQTRLAERSLAPKEPRPRTIASSTWLDNIYCGHCGERLSAIGKPGGVHSHYCRKAAEDPNCPHPGSQNDNGRFMVATARIEDAVERILQALAELAPEHPLLSRILSLQPGAERTATLRDSATAFFTTVKAGRAQTDKSGPRQIERRFVDVLLKPDIAEQLGVGQAISTGLYNAHFRGARPVSIRQAQSDD